MKTLTKECQKIVRFYEGDVEGCDPFWSDPKAYVTWNSLFFAEISNEEARVRDGKTLNPAFLEDEERLLYISRQLYKACRDWAAQEPLAVSRVERFDDYCLCRDQGRTISFTSTSTAGILPQYADKHGVAVMRLSIAPGTPCLPLARALDHYLKGEEEEILLPPWLKLHFKERAPQGEERQILDLDGKMPIVCADVDVWKSALEESGEIGSVPGGPEAGKRVFAALNRRKAPDQTDSRTYLAWKRQLQRKLAREFQSCEISE